MVLTTSLPPKSIAGQRRSRSQSSSSSSPVPIHTHRSHSPIKTKQKRAAVPLTTSHSDPLDHDSCYDKPPTSRNVSRGSRHLKAQKRQRHRNSFAALPRESPVQFMTLQPPFATQVGDFSLPSHFLATSAPSTPLHFPSSSSAFNFPERGRPTRPRSPIMHSANAPTSGTDELKRRALDDLRHSVADGDQRFLLRMLEWEHQKRSDAQVEPSSRSQITPEPIQLEDDDVDIILGSEVDNASPVEYMTDVSIASMDEDDRPSPHHYGEVQSFDCSDEETVFIQTVPASARNTFSIWSRTPSLTSGPSISSHSPSLESSYSSLPANLYGRRSQPPITTRTDKAVAALALALANGAAGLQDYQDLNLSQGPMEDRQAGELWN